MDLGAKIKEVLRGDSSEPREPTTTTTADTTTSDYSNTPGTFPETPRADPATTSGHHEHNKLHKPNDPRGWTDEERQARGHGYTDSGVGGINDPQQDSAYSYQPAETKFDDQRAVPTRDQGTQGTSFAQETEEPGYDSTAAAAAAGATTTLPSHERTDAPDTTTSGTQEGTQEGEHPYWGNLPQGGGVYNTVTGHGSKEDELERHRQVHDRQSQPGQVEATERLLDDDAAQTSHQRALPEDVTRTGGVDPSQNLEQGQDLQGQTLEGQNLRDQGLEGERPEEQKDSHYKEGLAGAAAAGAAGVGAYELSKKHDDDNLRRTSETQAPGYVDDKKDRGMFGVFRRGSKSSPKTKDELTETEQPAEHKEGKGFGLFHRGSSSSPTKTREEAVEPEQVPEEKKEGRSFALFRRGSKSQPEEKENIVTQEPKPEKEKKSGGLFHRSHDKGDLDRDLKEKNLEERQKDEGFDKAAPALALAGAGGAAAYAATRGHDEREARDKPLEGQQYETLPSGTSSGLRSQDTPAGQGLQSSQYGNDQYNTLSSGTSSGVRTQEPVSQDFARDSAVPPTRDPVAPTQEDSHFSNASAFGAGGLGAAGLGAGLLASQRNKRSDELGEQSTTRDPARELEPTSQTSDVVAPSSSLGEDTTGSQNITTDSGRNKTKELVDTSNLPEEPITKHANKGEYNVLSSGTPSGVKIDDDVDTADQTRSVPSVPSRTQDTQSSGDHHLGSKAAAGLGAAGLGAGAYEARHRDEREREKFSQPSVPGETQDPLDTDQHRDYQAPAGVGAAGLGAAGLGAAAAHEARKPEEKKFDKPFEGESLEQLGQRDPALQSQQDPLSQSQRDPLAQTQGDETLGEKDSHRGAYTAAGLGAAGLGAGAAAAAYNSRKPEEENLRDDTNQPLERDPLGQQQNDPLSQDSHRDARAAAASAFGARRPEDKPLEQARWKQSPQTEDRSLTGGSLAGIGGGGSDRVMHKCTECGKDNDISDYIKSALKSRSQ